MVEKVSFDNVKAYPDVVKGRWNASSVDSVQTYKNNIWANSKLGQATKGNMIELPFIQRLMNKLGVDVAASGPNVQLISKDSTQIVKGSLNNLIENKGMKAIDDGLKQSIKITELTNGGIKLEQGTAAALTDIQKETLKKAGITDNAIEALEKKGSYVVKKGTVESLVKTAGRSELDALTKAGVNIEQTAAFKISAGAEKGLLSKIATPIAKGLAKVPVIGTLITAAIEVPSIVNAFKNGDGLAQIGRSALAVTGSVVGMALGSFLGPVGTIAGAVVGDMIGRKLGTALLGEPKGEETSAAKTNSESTSSTKLASSNANIAAADTTDDVLLPYCKDMSFMSYC